MNEQSLKKKLNIMIVTVVLLVVGLTITSLALADAIVSVRNNRFVMSMGVELSINDNDGKPVVDIGDVVYEPGGTYKSEFSIANMSTIDVWYRVYFTDVKGTLKDYITVTIKEADGTVLCKGKMSELSSDSDKVYVSELPRETEKTLYIEFYFSPDSDNSAQGQTVSFNITANATQKQNNPKMDFGD